MIRPVAFSLGLLTLLLPLGQLQAAAPVPAQAWLKTKVDEAHKLAVRKVKAGTPEEDKWRSDTKAIIDDMLDWQTMTKESLGTQWEKLKPEEQKEFAGLLREIIEASYQSKLKLAARGEVKKPTAIKIDWLEEKVEGEKATITAKVKADKTVAQLDFALIWNGDRWHVWDISIDDVSTVRTYKTQFRKHITEKGFKGLLDLMKNKIEEIRSGRAELGP